VDEARLLNCFLSVSPIAEQDRCGRVCRSVLRDGWFTSGEHTPYFILFRAHVESGDWFR
jgi:hypothetical protein